MQPFHTLERSKSILLLHGFRESQKEGHYSYRYEQYWVPVLGARIGFQDWVPGFGAWIGCQDWFPGLGANLAPNPGAQC